MSYLPNIVFGLILAFGLGFFIKNLSTLRRNILLGQNVDFSGSKSKRLKNMIYIAFGQSEMVKRPIAGILHIIVYAAFVIINIEVIEIIIDGLFGTHRLFSSLGTLYAILIGSFEILAVLVIIAVLVFWIRRNIIKLNRFHKAEMTSWPRNDANFILYIEMILMFLFLIMNTSDLEFQHGGMGNIISGWLFELVEQVPANTLHMVERTAWWLHILGILFFLNYLYYSKHLHILLAFPNTYFASLKPKGCINNLESVTKEVKLMLDPNTDPFAVKDSKDEELPEKFGASDITDLNWLQLLNAYTCTECGRCTAVCPANLTGKKLSPRKIMMDTRDRVEEISKDLDAGKDTNSSDGKQLLDGYITREELWACTTCFACVEACPVSINPLSIIIDLRRYLVMEKSAASSELNSMMTNIENNGAPWPYNQMDRLNWTDELNVD